MNNKKYNKSLGRKIREQFNILTKSQDSWSTPLIPMKRQSDLSEYKVRLDYIKSFSGQLRVHNESMS